MTSSKIEVEFSEATDTRYEQFFFRQEGLPGLRLAGCWLPEFVAALKKPHSSEAFCLFQNYWCVNNRLGATFTISTSAVPLLRLDSTVRAKLIAHLTTDYAALL